MKSPSNDWLQNKKLGVHNYSDALLYPGTDMETAGVYIGGRLLPSTMLSAYRKVPNVIDLKSLEHPDVIEEPVIYIGVLFDCWGHCITDEMKFLWVFLNETCLPVDFCGAKCAYAVCPRGHALLKNFKKLLEAIGIPESRLIPVERPTILKTCCIPDECYWLNDDHSARYYTQEYPALVDMICSRLVTPLQNPPRKVYFSRTGWAGREFGECFIENAFARAGYEIIRPEKLSLEEMISLLQNVDCMASTEGSCAHNALFMKQGRELVIIKKYDGSDNLHQWAINKARNLHCTCINANFSVLFWNNKEKNHGPFFLYCSRELVRFLGSGRPSFPVITFVRYLCFSFFLKMIRFVSPLWQWVKKIFGCPDFKLLKRL